MNTPFSDGNLIYLRPLRHPDIPIWHKWFNDPEATAHMNKGVFSNSEIIQEEHLNHLSKSKNDVQLGIIFKSNDALVGTIGVHKIDWVHRRGDISLVVGEKDYWGKGVASEAIFLIVRHAFKKMNLHKLTAGMWSSNHASKRCFEKNGFNLEGTLRKQFFCNGSYVDEYRLGLLREEWESLLKNKE